MYKNRCLALLALFCAPLYGSYFDMGDVVVIKVPVADCLGKSAVEIEPAVKPQIVYDSLAFSPEKGPDSCPRIHQCLYNEVGKVQKETDEEVLVEFPHFYYLAADNAKMSRFWLLKNSVQRLRELKSSAVNSIPEPLQYEKPITQDERIATLVRPWQDPKTSIWYSVGTRFLRHAQRDSGESWGIHILDFSSQTSAVGLVSKLCALTSNSKLPAVIDSERSLFVSLLRTWLMAGADEGAGEIAYVWGGCSYFERYPSGEFCLEDGKRNGSDIAHWKRRHCHSGFVSGFDCSGLVLRAAQIARLNYFCKNTTTLGSELKDVEQPEPLEEGDLILIQGHVMVVSNLVDNKLLDAAGYGTGYGCVREIPLDKAFMNAATYDELRAIADGKKALDLKKSSGELLKTVPLVRLLKLVSQSKIDEAKK